MPALFSFLGGIANGYNASKAAEAKALQEERLEDKKLQGRMEIAKFEANAQLQRTQLQAIITGLINAMYDSALSEDQRADASRRLEDIRSRNPNYRALIDETLNQQSMGSEEQSPVKPENVPAVSTDTVSERLEVS